MGQWTWNPAQAHLPLCTLVHARCQPESAVNAGVPCLESTLVQDTDSEWQLIDTVATF